MKIKSIEKITMYIGQIQTEATNEMESWLELKGSKPMTKREKEAFMAGISRGLHETIF